MDESRFRRKNMRRPVRHDGEVDEVRVPDSILSHYQAVCACGWKNRVLQASPRLAQEDVDRHLNGRRKVA